MKLLIDFFPIFLFFAAFKIWGIYIATAVAIAATVVQIGYLHFKHGKVEPMQWLSLGVIVLFGGATLLSQSDTFIKWKPTVLSWLMGGALLCGQLFFRKNLLKSLMETAVDRIYFKDKQGAFVLVSRSEAEYLGACDPAEVIGKTDFDYFEPALAQAALEDEQELMRLGKSITGKEEKKRLLDGRTGWALVTKIPLRDADGGIIGT